MAKGKNEILLSIALEGDAEVKRKLQQVGDASKKSLADTEKTLGEAGRRLEGLSKPLGEVREALGPILEQGGIAGALGGSGLGGLGGIVSRFAAGFLSPAGLVAGITTALLGMAKLGEQTDKTKARLKAFGGGDNALDKLNDQARTLGTSNDTVQPGLEGLLSYRQRLVAEQEQRGGISHPPGVDPGDIFGSSPAILGGNAANSIPSRETLTRAFNALFAAGRQDTTSSSEIKSSVQQFLTEVTSSGSLSPQSLQRLRGTLPHAADLAAKSLSQSQGRNFSNAEQLAAYQQSTGKSIPAQTLFAGLEKQEPAALDAAAKSRGVSEAFEGLMGSTERLAEKFGGDHAGLTGGIDSITKLTDKAADAAEKFIDRSKENRAEPASQSLKDVVGSDKGDLLGRIVGFVREGSKNNPAPGEKGTDPFGVIADFVAKALTNPSAIPGNKVGEPSAPPVSPTSPFGFLGPLQQREQELQRQREQGGGLSKAADDQSKAAGDQLKAAEKLSDAAAKLASSAAKAAGKENSAAPDAKSVEDKSPAPTTGRQEDRAITDPSKMKKGVDYDNVSGAHYGHAAAWPKDRGRAARRRSPSARGQSRSERASVSGRPISLPL